MRPLGLALLIVAYAFQTQATTPTATINIGTIYGTQTSLPSAGVAVNKFLGVPFAESPPQRFSPPQAKSKLSAPLDVKQWKPACLQSFGPVGSGANNFTQGIFNQPELPESEDCLYLNVYAPNSTAPSGGRTVMFWIFGGAFQFGNAGQPLYDGSAFAAFQDVIVVSANYRTNVFGFPTSSQIPTSQRNLGLMDQRLALNWVQNNIAAFGGDPKKVTIFGESAGGQSVDTHLTAYNTANAPFRAAILQSGQVTYSPLDYTNYPATWNKFLNSVGCTNDSSELSCLRGLPASKIKDAASNGLYFYPTLDNVTAMSSPRSIRAAGRAANVPILGGSTAQEGRVFVGGVTDEKAFLANSFGRISSNIPKIQAYYDPKFSDIYPRISQINTDYGFLCAMARMANSSVSAPSAAPVWLYIYNASFPNSAFANSWGDSAAYHSSEIGAIWQTYAGGPVNPRSAAPLGLMQYQLAPTAQQQSLSRALMAMWANFAKNPAGGPGWTSLASGQVVGVLGNGSAGGVGVATQPTARVHDMCDLFAPYYDLYSH